MLSWQFTLSASLNCTGQVIFVLLMLPYIIIVIMIIIMDFMYIAHVQIINKIEEYVYKYRSFTVLEGNLERRIVRGLVYPNVQLS